MIENYLNSTAVFLSLLIIIAYPILRIIYNLYFHPLASIPGPWTWSCSRLPFIKSLLSGTLVHDFEKLHRKYGPIVRIAPNEVTFAQPEAWADIYQIRQGHQQFPKDQLWWKPPPGIPETFFNTPNPEKHARVRRILAPAFTPRALYAQEPFIQKYVNLLVERLKERIHLNGAAGGEVDISPWINWTTFDMFGDLGFGESFDCLQNSRYHPWISLLFDSVKAASFVAATRFYPLIEFLLMKSIPPSLNKTQMDHYQQIVDKVDRRLNWELDRPDIMSHVIKHDDSAKGLPVSELNATFMTMTTAGSETTATALCGAINYLVNNPQKLTILAEEIRNTFQSDEHITLEGIKDLPYLNATLQEALRLCPPIPWIIPKRIPAGGDTVCGIKLPEGTAVSIPAYTLFRAPAYFHSPSSFEPERWLPEASKDPSSPFFNDSRSSVLPFSTGPRNCLGQHLAWAEMRLVLAKLIWNFDVQAGEGKPVRWEEIKTFLLVEKKPIRIHLKSRNVL